MHPLRLDHSVFCEYSTFWIFILKPEPFRCTILIRMRVYESRMAQKVFACAFQMPFFTLVRMISFICSSLYFVFIQFSAEYFSHCALSLISLALFVHPQRGSRTKPSLGTEFILFSLTARSLSVHFPDIYVSMKIYLIAHTYFFPHIRSESRDENRVHALQCIQD